MRLIDADELMMRLRCNVLIDVTPELEKEIEQQPTTFDKGKVIEELENYLFEKYCVEGDENISEIVEKGGIE